MFFSNQILIYYFKNLMLYLSHKQEVMKTFIHIIISDFHIAQNYRWPSNNVFITIYYYLRNRKHVPCFYRVIQTRVEVWEKEKCCGYTSRRRVFPQLFRVLPNFHKCFHYLIETRSTCFLFLLENNASRKRKTTC